MDRGIFLKTLLGGIAAAPVAASAVMADKDLSGKVVNRNVSVKRWEHNGIKFAEWTFPSTVGPMFESADADKMVSNVAQSVVLHGKDAAKGIDHERRFIAPRRIIIPVFNRKTTVGSKLEELVQRIIEDYVNTDPVARFGKRPEGFDPSRAYPTHFIIVKVHGRPELLGLAAVPDEQVPVRDFYRGV
jgi:hypothetical protein